MGFRLISATLSILRLNVRRGPDTQTSQLLYAFVERHFVQERMYPLKCLETLVNNGLDAEVLRAGATYALVHQTLFCVRGALVCL